MQLRAEYKNSEAGIIPDDWNVFSLENICRLGSGTTPPRKMNERYFSNGTTNWVKTLDLNNSYVASTSEQVTKFALEETSLRIYPPGTVLVAMYGGYNQIGRTGHLIVPAAVNQAITAVQPDALRLNSGYLLYTLNFKIDYWKAVASSSRKDPNITSQDVKRFSIALPEISEQIAIANALSDADALIQSLQKLIAKKRQIKQGAIQTLLNPFDNDVLKAGWSVMKFGDIFNISGGFSASREQLSSDGFCYLHYGDIHGATKMFLDVDNQFSQIPKLHTPLSKISSKSILNDGDIVFVDASEDDEGVSRHIVVINPNGIPFISGLHTIVAKSKDDTLDNKFKRYCFQSAEIKSQFKFFAVGTKVSGISKTNIAKININLPPLKEQTRIATILSDMDADIVALETKLAKYQQIKQGMMQNLLTGRIRLA